MPKKTGGGKRHNRSELYEAWNRKLSHWWRYYNGDYLGSVLKEPLITLTHAETVLGQWQPDRRTLSISAMHIERDPWIQVMETLRHEMAHQYVTEVLKESDQRPHGHAFQRACHKLRCSSAPRLPRDGPDADGPYAHGCPSQITPVPEDPRILRIIKKTLSMAASPNEHEAQVAVNKARSLLLQYNVDLVELDRERHFGNRRLGPIKGRRASYELWLALLLQDFFFVEVLWVFDYDAARDRSGTVLQIHGTPTNLEMAEYTREYLVELVERLWRRYARERSLPNNRERQRYYAGVLEGFYRKLQQREKAAKMRLATVNDESLPSEDGAWAGGAQSLVWHGDGKLHDYFRYLNPHVRTRRGRGVAANEVYSHGVAEGHRVNIHKPLGSECGGFGGYLLGAATIDTS